MKICVVGWYFDEDFLESLTEITEKYPVTIVAHRDKLPERFKGVFDYHVTENKGLEYGAYDYYLKNLWDGDDVLFMHDDITIQPMIRNYELQSPLLVYDTIASFEEELVYIFKNYNDKKDCFDMHGRCMYASGSFLKDLKEKNGGFPVDENNDGHTFGPTPSYCKHYNWGVEELKKFWEVLKLEGCKVKSVIIPAMNYHIRGKKT